MSLRSFVLPLVFLAICLFLPAACGGGGGSGAGGEDSINQVGDVDTREATELLMTTLCGVQQNGELNNPATEGEFVSVQVIGSDAVIITRTEDELAGERQLVKLHSISSHNVESLRILHGIDVLEQKLSAGAYFVSAGNECEYLFADGGRGVLGQIFSPQGENMSELMLAQGSVVPEAHACGGAVLASCYQTVGLETRSLSNIELDVQSTALASRCGAVVQGALENPVNSAELVIAEAINPELLLATRLLGVDAGNPFLLKLHGVSSEGVSSARSLLAMDYIASAASGELSLVLHSQECKIGTLAGQQVQVGQLYLEEGLSLSEELLSKGFIAPASDACNGELLTACYQEIEAEAPEEVIPTPTPVPVPDDSDSDDDHDYDSPEDSVIRNFLWKPVSESNGNVVVLVNPRNVRVVVTGAHSETLRDHGPSNGRGTTARGSHRGCSYGQNVLVEFFAPSGARIPVYNGDPGVTVSNGCDRKEFRR